EGLQACEGKLVHLGMAQAPSHSTLAYANEHRSGEIDQDLFLALVDHPRQQLPGKLLSLDSSVIDLCVKVFPWAKFRATKGAVKLHLLLDHDGLLPHYAVITDGKQADVKVANTMCFPAGAMLIFDRGYNGCEWFHSLTMQRVHFATRLKENASLVVVESRRISDSSCVRADEIIVFTKQAAADGDRFLRRVVWWDERSQREFVYLTNHLDLAAATVAAIYRERWQVGVSSQGHIVQPVRDRPRLTDSGLVAWEAPWRENKTEEPSGNMLRKEYAQPTRLPCKVNADVASLHEIPVAETVYNARKQQGLAETGPIRQLSPAGYQRRHGGKDDVETGEALGARRRNPVEEMPAITLSGKCWHRHQGGGSGCSTDDGRAAKRARREGPGPVSNSARQGEAGVR
ncbi:MAG: IS4 family transposase, partial [Acidobacteriota bacterium]